LAYRWVTYHSILKEEYGDGVVFGASSEKQLEETLKAIDDGPLGKETVERVEGIWKMVEKEAPMDNYQDFVVKIGVTKELQEYMS
jgi:aflatoxin B1 aldehyde reductase